jgi:valyl-tRNA synthetase
VHRSTWPMPYELTRVAPEGDPDLLGLAGEALRQVRKAKSDRKLSMKAEVPLAEALGPAEVLEKLALVEGDVKSAGRIGKLDRLPGRTSELVIASAF